MITKIAATPHVLKYFVDGANPTEEKSAADLIADCVLGPLRDLLLSATGLQAWVRLPHTQADKLAMYLTLSADVDASAGPCNVNTGAASGLVAFDCSGAGDGRRFLINGAVTAFIELRFHHSAVR